MLTAAFPGVASSEYTRKVRREHRWRGAAADHSRADVARLIGGGTCAPRSAGADREGDHARRAPRARPPRRDDDLRCEGERHLTNRIGCGQLEAQAPAHGRPIALRPDRDLPARREPTVGVATGEQQREPRPALRAARACSPPSRQLERAPRSSTHACRVSTSSGSSTARSATPIGAVPSPGLLAWKASSRTAPGRTATRSTRRIPEELLERLRPDPARRAQQASPARRPRGRPTRGRTAAERLRISSAFRRSNEVAPAIGERGDRERQDEHDRRSRPEASSRRRSPSAAARLRPPRPAAPHRPSRRRAASSRPRASRKRRLGLAVAGRVARERCERRQRRAARRRSRHVRVAAASRGRRRARTRARTAAARRRRSAPERAAEWRRSTPRARARARTGRRGRRRRARVRERGRRARGAKPRIAPWEQDPGRRIREHERVRAHPLDEERRLDVRTQDVAVHPEETRRAERDGGGDRCCRAPPSESACSRATARRRRSVRPSSGDCDRIDDEEDGELRTRACCERGEREEQQLPAPGRRRQRKRTGRDGREDERIGDGLGEEPARVDHVRHRDGERRDTEGKAAAETEPARERRTRAGRRATWRPLRTPESRGRRARRRPAARPAPSAAGRRARGTAPARHGSAATRSRRANGRARRTCTRPRSTPA